MPPQPVVSVVIPCFNGAATLGAQLRSLVVQAVDAPFEVIVADNGSTDDPQRAVDALGDPRVRMVDASHRPGANVARNAGVRAAAPSSHHIVLCDADDIVHAGWLQAHLDALRAGAAITGGALNRVEADGTSLGRQTGLSDSLGFLPWAVSANMGVSRRVHGEVGGFDEAFRYGGDDTEFCWRVQLAGHAIVPVPEAVIDYAMRDTLDRALAQRRAYGESHVQLYEKFRDAGMPRSLGGRAARRAAVLGGRIVLGRQRERSRQQLAWLRAELAGHLTGSRQRRVLYL